MCMEHYDNEPYCDVYQLCAIFRAIKLYHKWWDYKQTNFASFYGHKDLAKILTQIENTLFLLSSINGKYS